MQIMGSIWKPTGSSWRGFWRRCISRSGIGFPLFQRVFMNFKNFQAYQGVTPFQKKSANSSQSDDEDDEELLDSEEEEQEEEEEEEEEDNEQIASKVDQQVSTSKSGKYL
jgi:hypothetical protein